MNLSKPPFDDVRVRQALNFAIDRRDVVDLARRSRPAEPPTCQILPPNFQGYEPLCPFTLDRRQRGVVRSGPRRGPHVDRRRRRCGEKVTLWVSELFPPQVVDAMRYVVEVLDELGIRASLKVEADPRFQEGIENR